MCLITMCYYMGSYWCLFKNPLRKKWKMTPHFILWDSGYQLFSLWSIFIDPNRLHFPSTIVSVLFLAYSKCTICSVVLKVMTLLIHNESIYLFIFAVSYKIVFLEPVLWCSGLYCCLQQWHPIRPLIRLLACLL